MRRTLADIERDLSEAHMRVLDLERELMRRTERCEEQSPTETFDRKQSFWSRWFGPWIP